MNDENRRKFLASYFEPEPGIPPSWVDISRHGPIYSRNGFWCGELGTDDPNDDSPFPTDWQPRRFDEEIAAAWLIAEKLHYSILCIDAFEKPRYVAGLWFDGQLTFCDGPDISYDNLHKFMSPMCEDVREAICESARLYIMAEGEEE